MDYDPGYAEALPAAPDDPTCGQRYKRSYIGVTLSNLNPLYLFRRPTPTRDAEVAKKNAAFQFLVIRALAFLRYINLGSYMALIILYFVQIDGQFSTIDCDSTSYCSNNFLLDSSCHPTGEQCHVNLFVTVPVYIFVMLSFTLARVTKYISLIFDLDEQQSLCTQVGAAMLRVLAQIFIICVFIVSALCLPFGYQIQNDQNRGVVFTHFQPQGLHISVIVAISVMLLSLPSLAVRNRFPDSTGSTVAAAVSVCMLPIASLTLVVHTIVTTLIELVNEWFFINNSWFFPGVYQDQPYLGYRIVRTVFSFTTLLESVLVFLYFNSVRRVADLAWEEDRALWMWLGPMGVVEWVFRLTQQHRQDAPGKISMQGKV